MEATNILLVDDNRDTCDSMSDIFSDLGYTVDIACDGTAALELSRRHQYRLALLDYNMPGMNGLELFRRLKNSQPSIVVALITAFSSIVAGAADAAGVRCSLLKPVDFSVLVPFVDEVVNGRVDKPAVSCSSLPAAT
jgi:CheY-like chemotaxis protein